MFKPEEWQDLGSQSCWGQDYPSDVVAIFMADHNDQVAAMFNLIEFSTIKMGFECYVHPKDAMEWIKKHRPHLINALTRYAEDVNSWADES